MIQAYTIGVNSCCDKSVILGTLDADRRQGAASDVAVFCHLLFYTVLLDTIDVHSRQIVYVVRQKVPSVPSPVPS